MDYKKAYEELLLSDRVNLRERLCEDIIQYRPAYTAGMVTAAALTLEGFIRSGRHTVWEVAATPKRRGVKPGTKRGPYRKRRKKK